MIVKLTPYQSSHLADLSYDFDAVQHQFSALPKERIPMLNDEQLALTIMADDKAVGFFIIDNGKDKFDYTDNANAVLLRSMSINPAYQGQGIAKRALNHPALQTLITTKFPQANEIVLGVNHANLSAQKLYLNSGFVDTTRRYQGLKGEQFIYSKQLLPFKLPLQ